MHDTKTPDTPPAPERPRLSASALAAVVQAAYILDAVRR
jgi:hypothetical protein